MSRPSHRRRNRATGISVWLIALAVAVVATIQIRSEVEVQRSLVGVDPTSLAFLIDDLHRANDALDAQKTDLSSQRAHLQSGQSGAADQVLSAEADQLRAVEGLVPVHGPGVVLEIDASGLTALDVQDAVNNLLAAGGEAIDINGHRIVMGVPITTVSSPLTISVIGDPTRLGLVADLMTQQLRADRRVRGATYRIETDIMIASVISEKPFVYAVPS
ncbi:MAG TPA: DUF881 domain-containing protein [Candidatus Dormibacteraeota bacterium]|nr:DUF881 domain-containing protein [Candidatus Dormibacteraeota bacterium]